MVASYCVLLSVFAIILYKYRDWHPYEISNLVECIEDREMINNYTYKVKVKCGKSHCKFQLTAYQLESKENSDIPTTFTIKRAKSI